MKRLALVTVVLGALAAAAAAQERAATAAQPPVFRTAVSLVALNVTVTDKNGFVTGLGQEDFAVFEDGVQQPIQFFETRDVPIDLILLLDTSSSIRDRLPIVHAAAIGFMKTLRPVDHGAIVTFGDSVRVAQPLTADQAALESAILGTRGYGGTALYNALYISLRQFATPIRNSGEVRRRVFAVLSDGEDTASLLDFDDILSQARRSGVTIYTIHLKPDFVAPTARLARQASDSEFAMRRLAQETGGATFMAEHVNALSEIYEGIAEELASQYSIGYAPTDRAADGRFRRITVRVAGRPDLRLRARTGYLADAGAVVRGR